MKKKLLKATLLFVLFITLGLMTGCKRDSSKKVESGTDWPQKSINLVVPFGAGGSSDYNARAIGKYLIEEFGQSIVVTNVPGSGGTVGAAQVKKATPDGYTVLVSQLSMNIAQVTGMVDFGFEDFESACIFSRSGDEMIAVRADAHWNTIGELIADSQKNPGKYKMTANTGASTQWVAIALLEAGAKLNIVSSGGSGERVQLLLGKHVDVIPIPITLANGYVKSGEFKLIATVSPERSKFAPDVETFKENNIGCSYYYNNTFFFPKGTDIEIIKKFNAAVKKIVETNEEYRAEMDKIMQPPVFMDRDETSAYYKAELDNLMKIADQLKGKSK